MRNRLRPHPANSAQDKTNQSRLEIIVLYLFRLPIATRQPENQKIGLLKIHKIRFITIQNKNN
ncbi:hypothetical protein GCWU000324_02155 [Kingella oralis ATCC 51147]|uniref:Uncharacterized protein n=1 Tax=Kingella oralis ATCC 51147 TaxID=629741 RepID=C4GJD3_9NEIS|nr:hypothetical protein GCWU000324_02155 [Kingella oralis ATCC 51147]